MKQSLIRPALVLALAATLSACGGSDDDNYTVKGTVSGIVYPGAVLTTNGMDLPLGVPATPGGTVSFEFPNKLKYGDEYDVQFKSYPANQSQCGSLANTIANNKDTAGRLADINITLACDVDAYALNGTITGLTVDGLVLANGSNTGTLTIGKETTTTPKPYTFTMPVVQFGVSYNVVVVTQPAGLTCSVANGTGVMAAANVTNVAVTCVPN